MFENLITLSRAELVQLFRAWQQDAQHAGGDGSAVQTADSFLFRLARLRQGRQYYPGMLVTSTYANAPVAPEQQYPVGKLVSVQGSDGAVLAHFEVLKSTDTVITGVIVWVAGEDL